jgi:hypothetical protein
MCGLLWYSDRGRTEMRQTASLDHPPILAAGSSVRAKGVS